MPQTPAPPKKFRPLEDLRVKSGVVLFIGLFGLVGGYTPMLSAALTVIGAAVLWYAVRRARAEVALPVPSAAAPPPPPAEPQAPIPFETIRAKHGQPAVALIRPYPPPTAHTVRSRFGGLPDLPAGAPWPRSSRGDALHFLAQVDLAELPWRPDSLPARGTLLFFARVDETMDWDVDPVRVVYDASSRGVATPPPDDLRVIEDGRNDVDRAFRLDGEPGTTVYPAWPLVGHAIESMPDPEGLAQNAWHKPAYLHYPAALMQFRADQVRRATGWAPTDGRMTPLPIFETRDRRPTLRSHDETGFPWVADAVVWTCRALLKALPRLDEAARASLAEIRVRAGAREPSSPWVGDEGRAFVGLVSGVLDAMERRDCERVVHAIEAAMRQVVTRAGGDPALAAALPDALYEAVRPVHVPITRSRRAVPGEDDPPWTSDDHQRVRHHQMFGHVPSTQAPKPVDSPLLCLLQLQSDGGANLLLCDLGEAEFWITPEDLAALRFDAVTGTTAGG